MVIIQQAMGNNAITNVTITTSSASSLPNLIPFTDVIRPASDITFRFPKQ